MSELGLPRGSLHRFLATLMHSGYIEKDAATNRYRVSLKAFTTGIAYITQSELLTRSYPFLQELSHRTGLSSHLAVWDGDTVLYLQNVTDPRVELYPELGARRPLHATALGKCCMAFANEERWIKLFDTQLERFTPNTIMDVNHMRKELESVRNLGYAVDDEERIVGFRCVAAPVRSRDGEVIAAISITGNLEIVSAKRMPELAEAVRDTALRISVQMGYRPDTPVGLR